MYIHDIFYKQQTNTFKLYYGTNYSLMHTKLGTVEGWAVEVLEERLRIGQRECSNGKEIGFWIMCMYDLNVQIWPGRVSMVSYLWYHRYTICWDHTWFRNRFPCHLIDENHVSLFSTSCVPLTLQLSLVWYALDYNSCHSMSCIVWRGSYGKNGTRGGRQRLTFLANDKSSMIFTTFHSQSHTQTNVSGYVVKLQGGGADTMDHCICHYHGSSPI